MKRKLGFPLVLSVIMIMALCSPVWAYIGGDNNGNGDHGGGNGDDGGGNGDDGGGNGDGEPIPEHSFPGGINVGDVTVIRNPEGIPVVDEYGQPVSGQPLIDENGNPITGPSGDPLYAINGQVVEIRSGQTIINIGDTGPGEGDTGPGEGDTGPGEGDTGPGEGDTGPGEGDTGPGEGEIFVSDPVYITNPEGIPVVDEYGQPVSGQPLIDENGNPITGPNGDPLYYISGRMVEVRSGQTIISIFDLIRDSEGGTSSSGGGTSSSGGGTSSSGGGTSSSGDGQSQGPPPQVEIPRGLSERIITYTRPIEFNWPARHTILSGPIPMWSTVDGEILIDSNGNSIMGRQIIEIGVDPVTTLGLGIPFWVVTPEVREIIGPNST